jgi:hypothetical protein
VIHLTAIHGFDVFPWLDELVDQYPTIARLVAWGVGMLSYHQDAKHRLVSWAILSQMFACACLFSLLTVWFTHRSWPTFVIAPPLIWVHVQFTKRWWARPGAWW